MDKKSKKILMHYMDDTKRKLLSFACFDVPSCCIPPMAILP